jgi:site-specific recombinase XerD
MHIPYNLYNLEPSFREFLIAGNISPITLKNYLSDYRHFSGWITFHLKNHPASVLLSAKIIGDYKDYLIVNNLPIKTVNRRLSTIRKFCSFCISQGWLKENPAKKICNHNPLAGKVISKQTPSIINDFEADLIKQGINTQTITNYLADVQELLSV